MNRILTLALFVFFGLLLIILSPSRKITDFNKFYESEHIAVIDGKIVKDSFEDEPELYIKKDFIEKYIDENIYWDEQEGFLTITNDDKVIQMKTDELSYYVNNEQLKLTLPVYKTQDFVFVPSDIISGLYGLEITYCGNGVAVFESKTAEKKTAQLKKKAYLRYAPNKKSPSSEVIKKGQSVTVLEYSEKGYSKVISESGYVGYIKSKKLSEIQTTKSSAQIQQNTSPQINGKKINMVFDQVTTLAANIDRLPPKGVNVVCPTWFSFGNTDGNIQNIADKAYVENAHSQGVQVWALITDNFTNSISESVISSTSMRQKVIKQILAYCSLYELDGINIDFEAVPKDKGEEFTQFIRELKPLLKQQGGILSVDLSVPRRWTAHYDKNAIGQAADYVVVMGYDQHYSGSESGSVATIGWSEEAIDLTADLGVPSEKIILGIPFYTRIWNEKDGKTTSEAAGMEKAYKFMTDLGGDFKWLEDIGQYYSEVTTDEGTYKCWLEDEASVRKRVQLAVDKNTAGCAAWKRGFEKEEIWDILEEILIK